MPFGLGTIAMIGSGAIAAAIGFIPIAIWFGSAGIIAVGQSSIGAITAGSTFATNGSTITGVGAAIASLIP